MLGIAERQPVAHSIERRSMAKRNARKRALSLSSIKVRQLFRANTALGVILALQFAHKRGITGNDYVGGPFD